VGFVLTCVCFVDRCLSFFVLFLLAGLTDSDFPFGIFNLFLEGIENDIVGYKTFHSQYLGAEDDTVHYKKFGTD